MVNHPSHYKTYNFDMKNKYDPSTWVALAALLYNFIILGIFIFLAIYFDRWWVVLCSLLFMSYPGLREKVDELKERESDDQN